MRFFLFFIMFLGFFLPAWAGGKTIMSYQCEVTGERVEDCMLGCKTVEVCKQEESALQALQETQSVTFYVLNGSGERPLPKDGLVLVGGYLSLENKKAEGEFAQKIGREFLQSIVRDGVVSACFLPRHAVRVQTEDHSYDFVLCFECASMSLYRDGEYVSYFTVTRDADAMNKLVKEAGMDIPAYYRDTQE